jgi:hypothetical protein
MYCKAPLAVGFYIVQESGWTSSVGRTLKLLTRAESSVAVLMMTRVSVVRQLAAVHTIAARRGTRAGAATGEEEGEEEEEARRWRQRRR